ncbi:hypothetical protein NLU13_7497 [Sarocladium strictum]|uniref:DNA excision repair protein ERCC-8 n=1 Tax=Sarocladium strictum TaxID=5046 RepID=A0AA39GDL6_SARSR|nr:hypothetical protein NLU13_7497 [Sarocladium strictum]
MQTHFLARETGDLSPDSYSREATSYLLRSFAAAPHHRFDGQVGFDDQSRPRDIRAHGAGVSTIAVERFDGRVLLSGGSEGALKLWDLEESGNPHDAHVYRPVATVARIPAGEKGRGHSHGITHVAFYPFDPDAFLSSSYDKSLKLWSTETVQLSAHFDLNATVYSHSTSPIADHLLVACATQHSSVRLVDLKSGAAVHALVAHGGPVLATAWSPRHEHVLVSGHADGKVRVWDVRRSGGVLALLDQEDSMGMVQRLKESKAAGERGRLPRYNDNAQAHDEAVNGVAWTDDGRYIISSGLDRKIRVWDAATGANTLASYGAVVQNQQAKTATIVTSPTVLSLNRQIMFWPNEQEILMLDLHEGHLLGRLRSPGATNPLGHKQGLTGRNRITGIAWRSAGGGGRQIGPVMGGANSIGALYSAHMDGSIRAWMPQLPGVEDFAEEDEDIGEDAEARKRKRKAVDDAYKSLMGKKVTFT